MATTTDRNPYAPPEAVRPAPADPIGPKVVCWVVILVGAWLVGWVLPNSIPREWWLATLPILILALPLVVNPFQVHQNQWIALTPQYQPFDPAGGVVPPEAVGPMAAIATELGQAGFTRELARQTVGSNPSATGFVLLFRHRQTLEMAKVIVVLAQTAVTRTVNLSMGFTSEFADGTEVVTSNRTVAKMLPPYPPPYHAAVFPEVREATHLLRLHRAHVAEVASGRIAVDPIGADPVESLRRKDHQRFLDHCLATGYTWVDEAAGRHRYTWKGAVLTAWKLTPPIKQVRLALERQAARRHRARLEGR